MYTRGKDVTSNIGTLVLETVLMNKCEKCVKKCLFCTILSVNLHVPDEKINCIAFSCFKLNPFENVLETI